MLNQLLITELDCLQTDGYLCEDKRWQVLQINIEFLNAKFYAFLRDQLTYGRQVRFNWMLLIDDPSDEYAVLVISALLCLLGHYFHCSYGLQRKRAQTSELLQ